MKSFDVLVIGSGPGGYIAAIRAAQLGFKTAIVEKYNTLGGTCLNVGCIPSKAMLDGSEHYYNASKHFGDFGINIHKMNLDYPKMVDRKNDVVEQTTNGVKFLMDKNKIEVFHGVGSFKDATHVVITNEKGDTEEIEAKNTIIATGSKPASLPFIKIDKERIITSTEALNLKEIPKKMVVIGGGVIGLELGSVFQRVGTQVEVIEYLDRIIPGMDGEMSKELQKSLKKQGMKIYTSHQVEAVENKGNNVVISAKNKKGDTEVFEADYCLVAVGRKPYTEGLGLENIGVEVDERGRIKTNENLQTNLPNIYAIGDVIVGPMLAHKAEEEGVFVAEKIAGQKPHIDYNLIPGVVYTWPEVGAVGKTEEELKAENREYKVGKYPFRALGRARASGDLDGVAKILADKNTDEILGVHIIGARAADLIAEGVVAMEYRASAEDLGRICHAHPTYSEATKEAALNAWNNSALNI